MPSIAIALAGYEDLAALVTVSQDKTAQRIREILEAERSKGWPFEQAWSYALHKVQPEDWGADLPPREDEEISPLRFMRQHFEAAYGGHDDLALAA